MPSVSVVINTFNRADLLDDAIRGVQQLDYPEFELIVVNGPSTDHTEAVLDRWKSKIKLHSCDVANLSVSRNIGIEAAAGELVAFLDDDAAPHPDWLSHLARHYVDPRVGGVGGFTIDNTGVRWQVRKTVCDRFGNAYFVNDFFDERNLSVPGTPFYPSLLGTNSSFRLSALEQIGGFDHTFAYLLDETDVCLRLVDTGWKVLYEPDALIFHQFAASHIRTQSRKPRTLYPSVVSKTYFMNFHGQVEGYSGVAKAIGDYREELFRANQWLAEHGEISEEHRIKLDNDVEQGTKAGLNASYRAHLDNKSVGDLDTNKKPASFKNLATSEKLRIALVSQGIPPENDAGIARWTGLVAMGLRNLGHSVHIITRAQKLPSRRFKDGIWYHSIRPDDEGAAEISAFYDVPKSGIADWMSAVAKEIEFLKTFGLQLVSFPIWDLEALPALDDDQLACVMSLHTTYALARPFKPEWTSRVIYGRNFVDRVIRAEAAALDRAPHILANSESIITDIQANYDVEIVPRCTVVPHGTSDILETVGLELQDKLKQSKARRVMHVLVPGRFELRKGYDLALKIAKKLEDNQAIKFDFVGQTIDDAVVSAAIQQSGVDPRELTNATFHGNVDRQRLDELYAYSDSVMMLSRFESFGLVAIEAMSAGSPVVCLANGALPEVVVDNVSGVLIPENSRTVNAVVTALTRLSLDSDYREQLSVSAYNTYKSKFTIEAMAASIATVYMQAIEAQGNVKTMIDPKWFAEVSSYAKPNLQGRSLVDLCKELSDPAELLPFLLIHASGFTDWTKTRNAIRQSVSANARPTQSKLSAIKSSSTAIAYRHLHDNLLAILVENDVSREEGRNGNAGRMERISELVRHRALNSSDGKLAPHLFITKDE